MSTKHLLETELYDTMVSTNVQIVDLKLITTDPQQAIEMGKQLFQDVEPLGLKREEVYIPSIKPNDAPVRCLKYSNINAKKQEPSYKYMVGVGLVETPN